MDLTRYLVVRTDGQCRVTVRPPTLDYTEVAFKLRIALPVVSRPIPEVQLVYPDVTEGATLTGSALVEEVDNGGPAEPR